MENSKNINSNDIPQDNSYYDNCVMCNCVTNEPKHRNIDNRNFYIEGSGQLCERCFVETYNYGRNKTMGYIR